MTERQEDKLGGARLKWQLTKGGQPQWESKLLVYRGGFLRFVQPKGKPGTVGQLEFWDGKGRVRHKVGSPIFGNEFATDETDYGNKLASWGAKSGKTSGGKYNKSGKNGHAPPGWWRNYERTDLTKKQKDQQSGSGNNKKIKQGGYVRWKQDDETDAAKRYTTPYRYDGSKAHDRAIGEPTSIRFKYQLEAIKSANSSIKAAAQSRTDLQIHPDGECEDSVMSGTAGCIGIQTFVDCENIDDTLTNYHSLKLKVGLK